MWKKRVQRVRLVRDVGIILEVDFLFGIFGALYCCEPPALLQRKEDDFFIFYHQRYDTRMIVEPKDTYSLWHSSHF